MRPRITAVMPTGNRQGHVPRAIECFLSQSILEKQDVELLILDDGDLPCPDLIPFEPCVRYLYFPNSPRANIGAKRNAINRLAHGEIIVHWDDDDWSAPYRIEHELSLLAYSGCKVVGYHDLLYCREEDKALFKYRFSGSGPYATGTSQCYYKSWWAGHPFAEVKSGEDSQFSLKAQSAGQLFSTNSCGMLVASAHIGSTSNPQFGGPDFPIAHPDEFPKGFLQSVGFYGSIANGENGSEEVHRG